MHRRSPTQIARSSASLWTCTGQKESGSKDEAERLAARLREQKTKKAGREAPLLPPPRRGRLSLLLILPALIPVAAIVVLLTAWFLCRFSRRPEPIGIAHVFPPVTF